MGSIELEPKWEQSSDPVVSSFFNSQKEWLEEPVLDRWKTDPSKVLALEEVSSLHKEWAKSRSGPFSSHVDPLWLETGKIMRDAGLPWHTNNVNMPEEIDKSWPLHFKTFERHAILAKGARVSCRDVTGYVTNWLEANHYGIRALQHELRIRSDKRPILVGCEIEEEVLESASQLFGLDTVRVSSDEAKARLQLMRLSGKDRRPIIFAATLGSSTGKVDDFKNIQKLQKEFGILLHIDASRTFDYVTTLSSRDEERLGTVQLQLQHPFEHNNGHTELQKSCIIAATIAAGGANWVSPPYVAILKPPGLGVSSEVKIEYVRGKDRTISGSRDSIGPLWSCLQELRFGPSGLQKIYSQCLQKRQILHQTLNELGLITEAPPSTLDLLLKGLSIPNTICHQWGIKPVSRGTYLLTVQPTVSKDDMEGLIQDLFPRKHILLPHVFIEGPDLGSDDRTMCRNLTRVIKIAVDHFRSVTSQSGGYPLNLALYSGLGPILSHFLHLEPAIEWVEQKSEEIQQAYKANFGLFQENYGSFPSCFTTGGTMGNMIALHTAVTQFPHAFVYYSSATHYSIKKIIRDSDEFTRRWDRSGTKTRFVEIPSDDLGCIIPDELMSRALRDRDSCIADRRGFQVILMCNLGSTFVGGRDNIIELRQRLAMHNIEVAYTHVDGALELGFSSSSLILGKPGINSINGLPVVQGVTLSHHKALGLMVSGLVICYNPTGQLTPKETPIDSRAIFEIWLFQKMYSSKDRLTIRQYCQWNSERLRKGLAEANISSRFNEDCLITVLERPPPWLIADFHLAPEGDWAHFITMPHITPTTVDHFVNRLVEIEFQFSRMYDVFRVLFEDALGQETHFRRLRPSDDQVLELIISSKSQLFKNSQGSEVCVKWLKRNYVYSLMSFALMPSHGLDTPLAVFLATADADRCLAPGPVLVSIPSCSNNVGQLESLGSNAYKWIADRMGLTIIHS